MSLKLLHSVEQKLLPNMPRLPMRCVARCCGTKPKKSDFMYHQWRDLRDQYHQKGFLLLFQVGDFYELYESDAEEVSQKLGLKLAKKSVSQFTSMAGFPVKSLEAFIPSLVKQHSYRIAVCDQISSSEREPSQILSRKVTAMITPGTLRCSLDPNSSNILLAVADSSQDPTTLGLCWADISTGLFKITHVRRDCIAGDIARLAPSEILYDATSPPFPAAAFWKNAENYFYTPWEISALDPHCHLPKPEYFTETIMKLVPRFYDYSKHKGSLLAGCQHPQWNSVLPFMKECEKKACILLLDYLLATGNHHEPLLNSPHAHLSSTHFLPRPILNEPSFFERNHHLYMDAHTLQHLELLQSVDGVAKMSLAGVMSTYMMTSNAKRQLKSFISSPFTDPHEITQRLDLVHYFTLLRKSAHGGSNMIQTELSACCDLERTLKLAIDPLHLASLSQTLLSADKITTILAEFNQNDASRAFNRLSDSHQSLLAHSTAWISQSNFSAYLHSASIYLETCPDPEMMATKPSDPPSWEHLLQERPALRKTQSEYVKLVELRKKREQFIADLKSQFKDRLAVEGHPNRAIKVSLSVGNGMDDGAEIFVRIPTATLSQLSPEEQASFAKHHGLYFASRSSAVVRFKTDAISQFENEYSKVLCEWESSQASLRDEIISQLNLYADKITLVKEFLCMVDISLGFATLAEIHNYCRPEIVQDPNSTALLSIQAGRHPVLDFHVRNSAENPLVPNDCRLQIGHGMLQIVTGPNMGGKSTFLRQNALMAIMAQVGSFVPAASAKLSVVDRIFGRIGAADNIAKNQSTFMMEMNELAEILLHATPHSLVILDELGRGTSVVDGTAIAQATIEYLHNTSRSRTLVSTHYHDLDVLAYLKNVAFFHVSLRMCPNNSYYYPYKILPGYCKKSYGIAVAALAGVPSSVIERAYHLLEQKNPQSADKTLHPSIASSA